MKDKSDRKFLMLLRLILGFISTYLVMNSLSIYSEPFGGCEKKGLSTLVSGCSSWQYFGLGIAIVFLFWIVKPKFRALKYWGFLFVALLALLGGPEALSNGILNSSTNMMYYWCDYGLVILFGGMVGIAILGILENG